jgi:hypothetical protein
MQLYQKNQLQLYELQHGMQLLKCKSCDSSTRKKQVTSHHATRVATRCNALRLGTQKIVSTHVATHTCDYHSRRSSGNDGTYDSIGFYNQLQLQMQLICDIQKVAENSIATANTTHM